MNDDRILVAKIGAPHGVKGEVRVKPFTAEAEALADYGPLTDKAGRAFPIKTLRPVKGGMLVVRFETVSSRDAAEALNGTELFVDRKALPPPDEDEFYHADLIGLAVIDREGNALGRVTAIHDFGAGDLLEFAAPDGKPILLPFTRAVVPEIDLTAGRLVVDPPEEIEGEEGDQ